MRPTHQQTASGASRTSLYEEVTDRIVHELEAGSVPWIKPWKNSGVALGMPRSAATSKFYSGINVLILWDAVMKHGYAAQEWLTFRQALSLGGHVRKGERGTTICYADSFIPKSERERAKEQGDDPNVVPFLKRFTVFNVEQCEGLPPHIARSAATGAAVRGSARSRAIDRCQRRAHPRGWGRGFLSSRRGFHPPSAALIFLTPADYYCTVLHELGHWTAHPSRLARDLQHRFGTSAYAREELIAELCSAFLCAHLNIVPQIRHADYLANWLQILKDDRHAIFHAASQASKASDFLLAFTHPAIPLQDAAEQEP